jgi:cobalt/nickel transport system permease protein
LLRAYDRGQRIHSAMRCRGFSGEMPVLRVLRFTLADVLFVLGWLAFFALARLGDLPQRIGEQLLRWTS